MFSCESQVLIQKAVDFAELRQQRSIDVGALSAGPYNGQASHTRVNGHLPQSLGFALPVPSREVRAYCHVSNLRVLAGKLIPPILVNDHNIG
jgi:hypothetical protein